MKVNGTPVEVPEAWREASLLEFLRENLGLTGTKFGCGRGICGACTIHLDGRAVRACQIPVDTLVDREVTTIEGLGAPGRPHPLQSAWVEHLVPQCGYCQAGQIMTAAAFLANRDHSAGSLEPEEIRSAMSGNLCRCGTYTRIREAVRRAADAVEPKP